MRMTRVRVGGCGEPVVCCHRRGRGVGRAIVERLLGDGGDVVIIEMEPTLWTGCRRTQPARGSSVVVGNAATRASPSRQQTERQALGVLVGWVNNAAVVPGRRA
jgi:NAD(P)-dependent dehydrogenase (short-subunit alcohol dehydrogenase family)